MCCSEIPLLAGWLSARPGCVFYCNRAVFNEGRLKFCLLIGPFCETLDHGRWDDPTTLFPLNKFKKAGFRFLSSFFSSFPPPPLPDFSSSIRNIPWVSWLLSYLLRKKTTLLILETTSHRLSQVSSFSLTLPLLQPWPPTQLATPMLRLLVQLS